MASNPFADSAEFGELYEICSFHGDRVRSYFESIADKNPNGVLLVGVEQCFLRLFQIASDRGLKPFSDKGSLIELKSLLLHEFFEQCSIHLQYCIEETAKHLKNILPKYEKALARNKKLHVSGDHVASQTIKNSLQALEQKMENLSKRKFHSVGEAYSEWSDHFGKYYEIIDRQRDYLKAINSFFDSYEKKKNDDTRLKLGWVGLGLSILGLCVALVKLKIFP